METQFKQKTISKVVISISLLLSTLAYSSEFVNLSDDEGVFQGSKYNYTRLNPTNFQRSREIKKDLESCTHDSTVQYLTVLSRLSPKTINALDMLDFKNIWDIRENPDLFKSKYLKTPELQEVKIVEDSLNNAKFASEVKAPGFSEETRYVKCNIEGISGWISNEILNLIDKVQEPVDTNIDTAKQVLPFNNKFILHGPPGNGKTTLVEKVAEVSDAHLIKITGSSLHAKFANCGAKKIKEAFAQALYYAGSHKHKKVIIFIDEADAFARIEICSKEAHFLSTTQELWQCLDRIKFEQQIHVILATNDYEKLHDTLTSRFNGNILKLSNPSKAVRKETIEYYVKLFDIPLFQVEFDQLVEQTEGLGIRDIELLFIVASEKVRKIRANLEEVLKKDPKAITKIIAQRLKAAKEELNKRQINERKKTIDDEIKEATLITLRNNIVMEKTLVPTIYGAGIGGTVGLCVGGVPGAVTGAKIGGAIGWGTGYLYHKGHLATAQKYTLQAFEHIKPHIKQTVSTLTVALLWKVLAEQHVMIKSKL